MDTDVKRALLDLKRDDGEYYPHDVVEAARDADSPLHSHFEWDNDKCGERYRLIQARHLIARYTITQETAPDEVVQVRKLFALRSDGGGYRDIEDIAVSRPLRSSLLNQLAGDLTALRARYLAVETVLRLPKFFQAVDEVIKTAEKVRQRKPPMKAGKQRRERRAAA